jgi:hypothetical protein
MTRLLVLTGLIHVAYEDRFKSRYMCLCRYRVLSMPTVDRLLCGYHLRWVICSWFCPEIGWSSFALSLVRLSAVVIGKLHSGIC